jgi:hypothetical protein
MADQRSLAEGGEDGLTCIPESIHCVATSEGSEDNNELDCVAVENFIDTLAEIALAVAARSVSHDDNKT